MRGIDAADDVVPGDAGRISVADAEDCAGNDVPAPEIVDDCGEDVEMPRKSMRAAF